MTIRFLLDENLWPRMKTLLLRCDPTIEVLRVGDEGAPPLGTSDPDILSYVERTQCILVTSNRKSKPGHVAEHFAAGRHHWGIMQLRIERPLAEIIESLHTIWGASTYEEWKDRTTWIP
ncbi:MAG: DUF5615 family PIN-like protein [Chloroflexaceae bacterium]|nr:DUF5615 family PIN-like protein [Chloroflexaceae bacterium]